MVIFLLPYPYICRVILHSLKLYNHTVKIYNAKKGGGDYCRQQKSL